MVLDSDPVTMNSIQLSSLIMILIPAAKRCLSDCIIKSSPPLLFSSSLLFIELSDFDLSSRHRLSLTLLSSMSFHLSRVVSSSLLVCLTVCETFIYRHRPSSRDSPSFSWSEWKLADLKHCQLSLSERLETPNWSNENQLIAGEPVGQSVSNHIMHEWTSNRGRSSLELTMNSGERWLFDWKTWKILIDQMFSLLFNPFLLGSIIILMQTTMRMINKATTWSFSHPLFCCYLLNVYPINKKIFIPKCKLINWHHDLYPCPIITVSQSLKYFTAPDVTVGQSIPRTVSLHLFFPTVLNYILCFSPESSFRIQTQSRSSLLFACPAFNSALLIVYHSLHSWRGNRQEKSWSRKKECKHGGKELNSFLIA